MSGSSTRLYQGSACRGAILQMPDFESVRRSIRTVPLQGLISSVIYVKFATQKNRGACIRKS